MMKAWKRALSCAVAATVLAAFGTACSKGSEGDVKLYKEGMKYTETVKGEPLPVYKETYEVMGGEDVMPIGGFFGPYPSGGSRDGNAAADFLTDDIFAKIQDVGVNMIVYARDRWYEGGTNSSMVKALDLAGKYGIGYFVEADFVSAQLGERTVDFPVENMTIGTPEGNARLAELIHEIQSSSENAQKSFLGIHAVDEPFISHLDNLEVLTTEFEKLGIEGVELFSNARGHWNGTDNFFGYSDPVTYDEYLGEFVDVFHPKMLSTTLYPFTLNTPDSSIVNLFNSLGYNRYFAKKYNIPYWRMLQAGGQWNDAQAYLDTTHFVETEGEMLFDVNVSLAYGAKAIQYFPIIQPEWFAYMTGDLRDYYWRCGLFGGDGNMTRWYSYAKRANMQVKAVDEYLMNATSVEILFHGDKANALALGNEEVPEDVYSATRGFRQLKKVEGDDCVIGCFDYKGGTALYVTNFDRVNKANVTLTFDAKDYRYKVIQRAVGTDVVGKSIPLTLDAGEGALIVLY